MSEPELTPEQRAQCREVRFAVVLYGGVSLAIYMNGVVQELYRLIRSSAVDPRSTGWDRRPLVPDAALTGTERVYRKLSRSGGRDTAVEKTAIDAPLLATFTVDVLSGASAGGINSLFLAKALANNTEMQPLEDMWIEEGDIGRLLNDRGSIEDMPNLREQSPPQSLLNSQRMFAKLVEAFEKMDRSPKASNEERYSLYAEELDLFITATDLHGTPYPITLSDRRVWERQYRNVFRLRHSVLDNVFDFDPSTDGGVPNKFLAFVARATSAFPFAFEPVTVHETVGSKANDEWLRLLEKRLTPGPPPELKHWRLVDRVFADGGYLDNKPFSYAIDALRWRSGEELVPVDRKLLYIEPVPTEPEKDISLRSVPDPISNAISAVAVIPRQETIRQDLERILEHNRLIRWAKTILDGIEKDYWNRFPHGKPEPNSSAFAQADLQLMVEERGVGYGGYYRLKIYSLTDDLATYLAVALGFETGSGRWTALRDLLRGWRKLRYVEYLPAGSQNGRSPDGKQTSNRFLLLFDLAYRLRRIAFVRSRGVELCRLQGIEAEEDEKTANDLLRYAFVKWIFPPAGAADFNTARIEFTDAILKHLIPLRSALRELREVRQRLLTPAADHPLIAFRDCGIELIVEELTRIPRGTLRRKRARELARDNTTVITSAIARVARIVGQSSRRARRECKKTLENPVPNEQPAARAAREALWHYYRYYDDYDGVALPILRATGLGEEQDEIEVIRVSPLDARGLIDESRPDSDQPSTEARRRRKLAGTTLFNFGAFLDRGWRRNDLLWGRLDGAERLIAALLPDPPELRDQLIEDAHRAILEEEFSKKDQAEVCGLLAKAVLSLRPEERNEAALRGMLEQSEDGSTHPALAAILRTAVKHPAVYDFFRTRYEVNRRFDRQATLRTTTRAVRVVGEMLEGIARKGGNTGSAGRWIARVGSIAWGLVELAVPGSFSNLIFRNTLKVLYAFEVALVVGGWLFVNQPIQNFGLIALGMTFLLHVIAFLLEDFVRRKSGYAWWILWSLVVALLVFALFGITIGIVGYRLPSGAPLIYKLPSDAPLMGILPLVLFLIAVAVVAIGRLWLGGFGERRAYRSWARGTVAFTILFYAAYGVYLAVDGPALLSWVKFAGLVPLTLLHLAVGVIEIVKGFARTLRQVNGWRRRRKEMETS